VAALGVASSREDDVAVLAVRFDPVEERAFRVVFPARPEELPALRAAMRSWLNEREFAEATQHALLLAVGEACANAIEHAYPGSEPGDVSVAIMEGTPRTLEVAVRDFGRFHPPSAADGPRGRGSTIMHKLTSDFSRESTAAGTTVRFRMRMEEHMSVQPRIGPMNAS
jgi:anti-sigma regulatory factor (Ser/Thr protein kinase)